MTGFVKQEHGATVATIGAKHLAAIGTLASPPEGGQDGGDLDSALRRIAVLEATINQLHGPLSVAALTARAERAEATLAQDGGVAVKALLDFEPQISFSHFGPERSIRWILEWFYKANDIPEAKAKHIVQSYVAALEEVAAALAHSTPVEAEWAQIIEECARAAEGPIYKERYRGVEGHNWSADRHHSNLYGNGRMGAADAIRALAAEPLPKPAIEAVTEADIYEQASLLAVPWASGTYFDGVEAYRKALGLKAKKLAALSQQGGEKL